MSILYSNIERGINLCRDIEDQEDHPVNINIEVEVEHLSLECVEVDTAEAKLAVQEGTTKDL